MIPQEDTISLDDVRAAQRTIQAAVDEGRLSPQEGARRAERVLHAVTPRDLWKASGGLAGSRRATAAARADRWKAVRLILAILLFAATSIAFITWVYATFGDGT